MSKTSKSSFLSGFSQNYRKTRSHILRKKRIFRNSYLNHYRSMRDSIRSGFHVNYIGRRDSIRNGYSTSYISHRDSVKNGFSMSFNNINGAFANNHVLRPSIIAALFFVFGLFMGMYVAPTYLTSATTNLDLEVNETENNSKYSVVSNDKAKTPTISYSRNATATTISKPQSDANSVAISVPANKLVAVSPQNGELAVPDYGVSYYGTLYMGHTPGIFGTLQYAKAGQKIIMGSKTYTITSVQVGLPITSSTTVAGYSMLDLATRPSGQIVLITCHGSAYRTLVFATID